MRFIPNGFCINGRLFSNLSAISWCEQGNFQWNDDDVRFVLDQQASWIFIELIHWNNSQRIDMSPRANNFLLLMSFGVVMVSVLASSVVVRGFEPGSGYTKYYEIGICCFSTKHATLRSKKLLARGINTNHAAIVFDITHHRPWVSEWLLLKANSICQLYHDANKVIFNELTRNHDDHGLVYVVERVWKYQSHLARYR
jgi:hypothetical protein